MKLKWVLLVLIGAAFHSNVSAGFPKTANAMVVAREVFQELDAQGQ